uniref:Uncharacterized protein n=1 Tax=Anopheles atroparvus TaxID=41427 RepID=A0A182ITZ1_ANOAO
MAKKFRSLSILECRGGGRTIRVAGRWQVQRAVGNGGGWTGIMSEDATVQQAIIASRAPIEWRMRGTMVLHRRLATDAAAVVQTEHNGKLNGGGAGSSSGNGKSGSTGNTPISGVPSMAMMLLMGGAAHNGSSNGHHTPTLPNGVGGSNGNSILTQAGLEEYSRSYYEQTTMYHHQKQSSYAQSEGYHSYVSSSDSSSTPFLDRITPFWANFVAASIGYESISGSGEVTMNGTTSTNTQEGVVFGLKTLENRHRNAFVHTSGGNGGSSSR